MLEPSRSGFTTAGQAPNPSSSAGRSTTANGALRIPFCARTSLVRPLSRHSAIVRQSLPVHGSDQNSQSAGTTASRLGPASPSAMLNTRSGRASRSRSGSSSVASTGITSPAADNASATAAIVTGSSHSA
jgi:hypothetical protein